MSAIDGIEKLFRENYRALSNLAFSILQDESAARDIVHDLFAELIASATQSPLPNPSNPPITSEVSEVSENSENSENSEVSENSEDSADGEGAIRAQDPESSDYSKQSESSELSPGYLRRAVRNRCLNRLRGLSVRERIHNLYRLDLDEEDENANPWPDEELLRLIYRIVEKDLSENCRKVVKLRFRDGLDTKEIASILGISRQAVYKHISHAVETLRSKLIPRNNTPQS